MVLRSSLAFVVVLALSAAVRAQDATAVSAQAAAEASAWSFDLSAADYVLPEEADFLLPIVKADHGRLHLEARYNYEAQDSTSLFAGGSFEPGDELQLTVMPMIGGVAGRTDGIIPAVEAELTVGSFEAYAEAEYLFDLGDSASSYFYMWSELSLWPASWLRAGVVTQRTRVYQTERDIQRGLLAGIAVGRVAGTVYFFNPGGDDRFTVVSVGVTF